ncbi:NADH-quinone oxidoreductase subunit A [Caldivirga sp. UBA161]|uniref:NADH-quinone oxidoreductase subunit A n=1 Tax=Caldivirga sp. UBA161 TaxID=1915569 RepID=UPI0025BCDE5B|nr:NADH-quinone oxidoreductase subunit A [Caldivirga sp. UBA161]
MAYWGVLAAVLFLAFIGLVVDGVILLIRRIIKVRVTNPIKVMRFEAGNAPVGPVRSTLPMQYVGFLLMFLAVEPIVALLLALSIAFTSPLNMGYALLFTAFILTYSPLIYVAYSDVKYMAYEAPRRVILSGSSE